MTTKILKQIASALGSEDKKQIESAAHKSLALILKKGDASHVLSFILLLNTLAKKDVAATIDIACLAITSSPPGSALQKQAITTILAHSSILAKDDPDTAIDADRLAFDYTLRASTDERLALSNWTANVKALAERDVAAGVATARRTLLKTPLRGVLRRRAVEIILKYADPLAKKDLTATLAALGRAAGNAKWGSARQARVVEKLLKYVEILAMDADDAERLKTVVVAFRVAADYSAGRPEKQAAAGWAKYVHALAGKNLLAAIREVRSIHVARDGAENHAPQRSPLQQQAAELWPVLQEGLEMAYRRHLRAEGRISSPSGPAPRGMM